MSGWRIIELFMPFQTVVSGLNLQPPTSHNKHQSFLIKLQHLCHRAAAAADFISRLSVTGQQINKETTRVAEWLWCDVRHYCGEKEEEEEEGQRLTGETLC